MPKTLATNALPIAFVTAFKYEMQGHLLDSGSSNVKVLQGETHIFLVHIKDGEKELAAFSLCGQEQSKIGQLTVVFDKHPALPTCKTCEKKYKAHPQSPWRHWVQSCKQAKGEKVKA